MLRKMMRILIDNVLITVCACDSVVTLGRWGMVKVILRQSCRKKDITVLALTGGGDY